MIGVQGFSATPRVTRETSVNRLFAVHECVYSQAPKLRFNVSSHLSPTTPLIRTLAFTLNDCSTRDVPVVPLDQNHPPTYLLVSPASGFPHAENLARCRLLSLRKRRPYNDILCGYRYGTGPRPMSARR